MNRRRAITILDIAALTVATIGAINWGFSAVNFNLVRRLFGRGSLLERTVYLVVGLAGIDLAWLTARFIAGGYQTPAPSTEELRQRLGMEAQQLGEQVQRGAQQVGHEMQQTGQEVQRGSYRQPGMRP
jgi:uncharacterized membrane protein YuzA (DUF378 family)